MDIDFESVVEHAPDMIFVVDARGCLTYVNLAAERVLGYERAEMLGKAYAGYLHPREMERARDSWQRLLSGEALSGVEFTAVHRDGREVPVLFDATPRFDASRRFLGVQGASREAATSEDRFREVIEYLPCAVYVAKPGWPPKILFISKIVESYAGITPDEMYADGAAAFLAIHPEDRERVVEQTRRFMHRPEPYTVEFRVLHRNGHDVYHVVSHSLPVLDADGKVVLRRGIIMDITNQKRLEMELFQSQRLAAIGEMAAMMAHEIRNPLAGMTLALRALRGPGGDEKLRQECLEDLEQCLRRIDETVSRALDFSKARPVKAQPCRLADVLAAARRLTATYVRKNNVELEVGLPPDLPELVADPDQLEQVFVNLILNACKAMPDGGRLTIRAWSDAHRLFAEVADTGIGVRPEQIDEIFDPFYSGFAEGTGLGLPLCQRILDAHGGSIRVESALGKGTTLRVELPLEPSHVLDPAG